jgi:hypothetical protein
MSEFKEQKWQSTGNGLSSFSGLCWLYGRVLYDKHQVPVGLIAGAWRRGSLQVRPILFARSSSAHT